MPDSALFCATLPCLAGLLGRPQCATSRYGFPSGNAFPVTPHARAARLDDPFHRPLSLQVVYGHGNWPSDPGGSDPSYDLLNTSTTTSTSESLAFGLPDEFVANETLNPICSPLIIHEACWDDFKDFELRGADPDHDSADTTTTPSVTSTRAFDFRALTGTVPVWPVGGLCGRSSCPLRVYCDNA